MTMTKVLIVDDHEDAATLIHRVCAVARTDATVCLSGAAALAELSERAADYYMAFLDISMPVMDGYELARIMRDKYPHIKIVVVSARPTVEESTKFLQPDESGVALAVRYYQKGSFTIEQIGDVVRQLQQPAMDGWQLSRSVLIGPSGVRVFLTDREADIMAVLIRMEGRSINSRDIAPLAYGEEMSTSTVKTTINGARRKMKAAGASLQIKANSGGFYLATK